MFFAKFVLIDLKIKMEKTGLEIFTLFKNKEWILDEDISILSDDIYGFFDGGSSSNEMYAYSNYLTKCKIVLLFKKENKLELKTKLGETICEKLVNFFEDSDHTIDKSNCGSTYYGYNIRS